MTKNDVFSESFKFCPKYVGKLFAKGKKINILAAGRSQYITITQTIPRSIPKKELKFSSSSTCQPASAKRRASAGTLYGKWLNYGKLPKTFAFNSFSVITCLCIFNARSCWTWKKRAESREPFSSTRAPSTISEQLMILHSIFQLELHEESTENTLKLCSCVCLLCASSCSHWHSFLCQLFGVLIEYKRLLADYVADILWQKKVLSTLRMCEFHFRLHPYFPWSNKNCASAQIQ